MNKKNIFYLSALIIVVALTVYLFKTKGSSGTISDKLKDFSIEDTASIDKIAILEKSGKSLVLTRSGDKGQWIINGGANARKDMVDVLLETLKRIEIKAPVNKAMLNNVIKQMATSSTKVDVFSGSKNIKSFYVGGATIDGLGTFMMLANAKEPFVMHIPGFEGYLSTRFNVNGELWKDRELFRYHPSMIDMVRIDYPNDPKSSFSLYIQDRNYARLTNLAGDTAKSINAEALKNYLEQYTDVQYQNPIELRKTLKDSVLIPSNLLATISVYDKQGKSKSVKLYKRYYNGRDFAPNGSEDEFDQDRVFVVIDDQVLVNGQYPTFNRLTVKYSYFLKPGN